MGRRNPVPWRSYTAWPRYVGESEQPGAFHREPKQYGMLTINGCVIALEIAIDDDTNDNNGAV